MSMVSSLHLGRSYTRQDLASLWGLGGSQAISRGVYTPRGTNEVFLFVTRIKQKCLTQYADFLQDDLLFWEGENGHGSDQRIASASASGDRIYLLYREKHHSPFVYYGQVLLTHWIRHETDPSEFVFQVVALAASQAETAGFGEVAEAEDDYVALSARAISGIDREVVAKSRGIAQRVFRGGLFRLWDGACAVTGVREPRILKAGHIKPWSQAATVEKVDCFNGLLLVPNLDSLFEEGLISFREDGSVMVSNRWDRDDQRRLHISADLHLRQVFEQTQPYLAYHREVRFVR